MASLTGGKLCERTGAACHGGTLAGTEFDIVNESTDRNFREGKGVADFGSDAAAGSDNLIYLETLGSDDVAIFAVFVLNESDAGGTVRIVLDGADRSGAFVLVAEEVDNAVHLLVTTADITHGELAGIVTAAGSVQRLEK